MLQKTIKTVWSQGVFDEEALGLLLGQITTALTDTGHTIISSSATHVDWMPAGAAAATDTNDDVPHWALAITPDTDNPSRDKLTAYAVWGASYTDGAARKAPQVAVRTYTTWVGASLTSRFYCNAGTGAWWLFVCDPADLTTSYGGMVGSRIRRYPIDTTQGIHARYCLLDVRVPGAYPAYYLNTSGSVPANLEVGVTSPMAGFASYLQRHAGSSFGPSVAPIQLDHTATMPSACILGELADAACITLGDYTLEQSISPGTIAVPGSDDGRLGLALPATTFAVLTDPRP